MSAKACASCQNVLDLWAYTDQTNRQLFQISGYGTSVPLGTNVTFANVGRTSEGCASYLSVAAAAGQCSNTKVLLGSKTGLGAASWEIQNVPGQPGYVYITNAVRVIGGGGSIAHAPYLPAHRMFTQCAPACPAPYPRPRPVPTIHAGPPRRQLHAVPGRQHQLQQHRGGHLQRWGPQRHRKVADDRGLVGPHLPTLIRKLAPHWEVLGARRDARTVPPMCDGTAWRSSPSTASQRTSLPARLLYVV